MRAQHNGQNGKLFADLQNTNDINYHFMRPPVHGRSRPSAVDSAGYSPVRGTRVQSGSRRRHRVYRVLGGSSLQAPGAHTTRLEDLSRSCITLHQIALVLVTIISHICYIIL